MTTAALLSLFLCVNGYVCLTCAIFHEGEIERGGAKCVCVCEREREREREPCHTLFHPATTAWWNTTSADEDNAIKLNFPFLERLHLNTNIYLSHDELSQPLNAPTSSPTPTLIFGFFSFSITPQKKRKKDCCIRVKSPLV